MRNNRAQRPRPTARSSSRDHHRGEHPDDDATYARAAAPQIASVYDTPRQRGERAAREKATRAQEDDLYFV